MKAATTADIKVALRRVYAQPEWALLFEVGDATGARHSRFADAIAMSLWPSRGLTLTGMEIKVSRSDWKKERDHPEKAETIAAFCDYWQLVTAPKVVLDATDIPPAWGWLEFNGARFVTRQAPTRTDVKSVDRTFLAALLRRAHKTDEGIIAAEVERMREIETASFEARVEAAAANKARQYSSLARQVAEFEAASGLSISNKAWKEPSAANLGRAAKAVTATGIDSTYMGLHMLSQSLRDMSESINKAMSDLGLPDREPSLADHVRKRRK